MSSVNEYTPPLPHYIGKEENALTVQDSIVNELFYRQQDERVAAVFRASCRLADKNGSSKIIYTELFDYLLRKDNPGVSVEISLHSAIKETFHMLSEAGYVRIINGNTNSEYPYAYLFILPQIAKISKWLKSVYNVSGSWQLANFPYPRPLPNIALVARQFEIVPDLLSQYIKFFSPDELRNKSLDEMETGYEFISVRFKDVVEGVTDVLLPIELNINQFAKSFLLPMVREVLDKNIRFREEVRAEFQKDIVVRDLKPEEAFHAVFDFNDTKLLNSVMVLKKYIMGSTFSEDYQRVLGRDFFSEGRTPLYLLQAVFLLEAILFNLKEDVTLSKTKADTQLIDFDHIIRYLIENCRDKVSDDEGFGGFQYYPVTIDMIGKLNDITGKKTLHDDYSSEEIENLVLNTRKKEKELVPFISRIDNGDEFLYFHRWRLIDIFYTERMRESARLFKYYVEEWSLLRSKEIPSEEHFNILEEQLSPFFQKLVRFCFNVCDAYPSIEELKSILLPGTLEIKLYDLYKSNLSPNAEDPKTQRALNNKVISFREELYGSLTSATHRNVKELLGIDYEELLLATKKAHKTIGDAPIRSNPDSFDSPLDLILYNILNFFYGLFRKDVKQKKRGAQTTKAGGGAVSPATKLVPLVSIADTLDIPAERATLKEVLDQKNEVWNKIFIDPKTHFPNWDQLSYGQKEEKRKELKNEVRKRMATSRQRVDEAVKERYSNFDLRGLDYNKLQEISKSMAEHLTKRDPGPLADYIRHYIVFLNTK